MNDRVPSPNQTGRVLISPEDGSAPFYATVKMADNPTNPGTPLNKQNLLQDMVAALYSENNQAVPNDIFSDLAPLVQHWWKKEVANGYVESLSQGSEYFNVADNEAGRTIQYSRSINIDQSNGNITLQNPVSVTVTVENRSQVYNALMGSYVLGAASDPSNIHKIALDATGSVDYSGQNVSMWFYGQYTYSVSSTVESSVTTMVVSPNRNQYPDDGQQDGATYTYQGNFLLDGPGAYIEVGSYVGTGTAGVNNKNQLTFSKPPKAVFISIDNQTSPFSIDQLCSGPIIHGAKTAYTLAENYVSYIHTSWEENKLLWYYTGSAVSQLNASGKTYFYFAII